MNAWRPIAAELMHAGPGADGGEVVDEHVAAERRVVAEDHVVADAAVVRHVGIGHEHVAIADRRLAPAAARAAMDRDELAEDVPLADAKVGFFAFELEVLRDEADRSERKHFGPVANIGGRRR